MSKSLMKFAKGMGLGLVVGCMAGAVANQYVHNGKKGLKRTAGKALKNLSGLMEDLGDMF